MKKVLAVLVATIGMFVGGACAQTTTVYQQGRFSSSYTSSTEVHVSRSGPSWQGNDFSNNPIGASRLNPVRTRTSSTVVDFGPYRYERTSGTVASSTVITPCGRSVTEVTRYSSSTTVTRAPYVIVPTSLGVTVGGIQPSYVDNTRSGGGWSGGSSATIIHHSYNPSLR